MNTTKELAEELVLKIYETLGNLSNVEINNLTSELFNTHGIILTDASGDPVQPPTGPKG